MTTKVKTKTVYVAIYDEYGDIYATSGTTRKQAIQNCNGNIKTIIELTLPKEDDIDIPTFQVAL